jgi:hypothetical protein
MKNNNWIGDNICQDNMHRCYNTTMLCEVGWWRFFANILAYFDLKLKECGHDGYAYKDPKYDKCISNLTGKCKTDSDKNGKVDSSWVSCSSDEQNNQLIMYDSFGNGGWDTTKLTTTPSGSKTNSFTRALSRMVWRADTIFFVPKNHLVIMSRPQHWSHDYVFQSEQLWAAHQSV